MDDTVLRYVSEYGYFALLIILTLGFVGLPLPEQTVLTFTGFIVSEGGLNYFLAIIITTTGIILGMLFSFFIGRYLGIHFLSKYGYLIGLSTKRLERIEVWFNKYGRITLSFGFFVPGLRHFTAYFAGLSKWNFNIFIIYIIPGALLWTTTFITVGMLLGENWREALVKLEQNLWLLFLVALLMIVGYWLYKKFKSHREENSNV